MGRLLVAFLGLVALLALPVTRASIFESSAAAGRLDTAFVDPASFGGNDAQNMFAHARDDGGAGYARLLLVWRSVAPPGPAKPDAFDAANPLAYDPNRWAPFDQQITDAAEAGIKPIVYIQNAPDWAENNGNGPSGRPVSAKPGTWKPSPSEFGAFAQAAAQRYSGAFCDPNAICTSNPDDSTACDATAGETCLPRVTNWQAWNEPNRIYFLYPQRVGGKAFAPRWYRRMVNAFAVGVHDVNGDNVVVAGGLSPYGKITGLAPMPFMRSMLCMSKKPYKPVCSATSSFETWAHHPYTCGGPNREAFSSEDIGVADLPEMRALLLAAIHWNRVVHKKPVKFWVTELGWITKPPRGDGVPLRLHARWVAEALYRSWRAHVSLVTWFPLVDVLRAQGPYQSGLYFSNLEPKTRSLLAYRFPFVAYVRSGRVYVWGRIPPNATGQYTAQSVLIQRRTSTGWRRVGRVDAGSTGLFAKTFRIATRGTLRAGATIDGVRVYANPFALKRPRDPYICAFGN